MKGTIHIRNIYDNTPVTNNNFRKVKNLINHTNDNRNAV